MIIKNCKTCGAKLVVIKTILDELGIKRVKHCTSCDVSLTSIEIHIGLYETLMRSHKEIQRQGLLHTVAPVSQDAQKPQSNEEFQAGIDEMVRGLGVEPSK
jgi:hypothetical protein